MKRHNTKLMIFLAAILLSALAFTTPVSARATDYSNLSISESSVPGTISSSKSIGEVNGCNIKYNKLVTIQFQSLPSTGSQGAQKVIQNALDYAREHYTKDTLYKIILPDGDYRLDYHLFIYSNTWLCMGQNTRLIKNYDASCMLKSNANTELFYGYNGASNIIIEGGIWYTDTTAFPTESSALRFGHGSNIYLKNTTVDGSYNGHHLTLCGVKDMTIEGCTFRNYTGAKNKDAVQFDICNNENIVGEYGYYDDTCEQNVLVTNCTFSDLCRGIGSHSAVYGVYYKDIAIADCTFTNMEKQAILGMNFKNVYVKNNVMNNVGSGIQIRYANPDAQNYYQPNPGTVSNVSADAKLSITGNKIETTLSTKQSNSYGIYIAGGEMNGQTYYVENATIDQNQISSEAHAIYLEYTNKSTVANNTIKKITLNSKSAPSNGITLTNSDNNTISGNKLGNTSTYDLIGHGISLRSGSTGNTIKNNTINKVKRAGIIIADASSATIKNNTINNAAVSGIIITDKKTNGTLVSGNKITACKTMGISVSADAKAKLSKNKISKSGKYGINVDHATATITGNTVTTSKAHGINIVNKATATITGNKITSNGNHGICFTSSKGSASKNTCSKNTGLGICCVDSGKVKLSGNTLSGNKKGEIYQGS